MKPNKKTNIFVFLLGAIASSFLYAVAIKCFIQLEGVNMLSNGVSGIALIFARLMARLGFKSDLMYSIFYVGINIPILILAYRRIGKMYTIFTIVNVVLSSILNVLIPSSLFSFMKLDPTQDMLLIAIGAGVIAGISSGIALRLGSSTGGVDTIITYMGVRFNKEVGFFSFIINGVIILTGGFLFNEWNAMLYTIVFIFVGSQVIDIIYRRTKKRMLKVVTTLKNEMADMMLSISKHGVTIFECEGAYSHSKKYELETTILEGEVKNMIRKIKEVDPNAFISVINVHDVVGNYTMPTIE